MVGTTGLRRSTIIVARGFRISTVAIIKPTPRIIQQTQFVPFGLFKVEIRMKKQVREKSSRRDAEARRSQSCYLKSLFNTTEIFDVSNKQKLKMRIQTTSSCLLVWLVVKIFSSSAISAPLREKILVLNKFIIRSKL